MKKRLSVAVLCIVVGLSAIAGSVWWHSPSRAIPQAIETCSSAAESMKALCYTDKIDALLQSSGLKAALALVAASYQADPAVATFCHSNMHELGAAAYRAFAAHQSIDLTTDASFCGFGFYHGFMEEMLLETGSMNQAEAFCSYVGKVLGGDQQYAEGSCYHGIGHGVTDGTDVYDRGDATALAASGLNLCRKITRPGGFAMRCASGVFNSVALMYPDPKYQLDAHDDPYALCRTPSYDHDEAVACYDQMNTLVAYLAQKDPARMIAYAQRISDPAYRSIALKAAVLMTYEAPTQNKIDDASTICTHLTGGDHEACVRGVIDSVIEFGPPQKEFDTALAVCEQRAWHATDAKICMDELVVYAQGITSRSTQHAICERIPDALVPERCSTL